MLPPSARVSRVLDYLAIAETHSLPHQWKDVYRIAFCVVYAARSDAPVSVDEAIATFTKSRYAKKIAVARDQRRDFLRPFIRDGHELSDAALSLETSRILELYGANHETEIPLVPRKRPGSVGDLVPLRRRFAVSGRSL